MRQILEILMLVLQIFSKLPASSRATIKEQISIGGLFDLLSGIMKRGGGGETPTDQPSGIEGWIALIMLLIRLLSELRDDDAEPLIEELKTRVESMRLELVHK